MNTPIQISPFKFPDLTHPNGALPDDMRAQACWYFYTLAQKQKESVGDSIDDQFGLLEDDLWMDKRYVQTAKTVAMMYNLESPDEFLRFFEFVKMEAASRGLPEPSPEYTRPLKRFVL